MLYDENMLTKQGRGLAWAITAAAISGVAVFVNSLVVKGIDPLVHTTIKNAMVGLMVVGVIMLSKDKQAIRQLNKYQWRNLLLIALIGGSVAFALFFTGLKQIGATEGQILNKTMVIWVALMAVPLLGEKLSKKVILGILLIYASSLVGGSWKSASLLTGHLMVLASTWLWAAESILVKKTVREVPVNIAVGARMGIGSLILIIMLYLTDKVPLVAKLSPTQWGLLLIVAAIMFGYVMSWYQALSDLPATLVASILTGAVIVTNTLNSLLLTKTYNLENMIQAALIIAGAGIVYLAAGRFAPVTGTEVKTRESNN